MTITVIRDSAHVDSLHALGAVPTPLSEPACQLKGQEVVLSGRPDCQTGLWECSPGRFQRAIEHGEVMHILAGSGTFLPEQGDPVVFHAGDTLFFPPHTRGVWEIVQTVRKLYVLV